MNELPFQSKPFADMWADWMTHRKEIRKPLTATAAKYQLRKLEVMGEKRAIAAIEHSITNSYQGIFEPYGAAQTQGTADAGEQLARKLGL